MHTKVLSHIIYYRSITESMYGSVANKLKKTSLGKYRQLHIQAKDQKMHTVVVPSKDPEVNIIYPHP